METETAEDVNYFLSRVIHAHQSDVKCICGTELDTVVSGSRDGHVKVFAKRDGDYVECSNFCSPGNLAVNVIAFYNASDGWRIFCGRKDGAIAVFVENKTDPWVVISLHTLNVCALYVDSVNRKLLSGSWDSSAIVWPIDEVLPDNEFSVLALSGHKMSVWAVTSFSERPGFYLTGSADLTIKLWNGDKVVKTFSGHDDVVRCLLIISNNLFLSSSNDSTIRLWNVEAGACLKKYNSLTGEYIYSMSRIFYNNAEYLVTSGEGGYVEVWKYRVDGDLQPHQLIPTPSQSIWSVTSVGNGDIGVGTNNGNVYIFTADPSRKSDPQLSALYDDQVAAKIAAIEHQKAAERKEVVTIKVALDDGQPNLELRYRKGTDPAEAAQVFLQENNISPIYLDEIVQYIKSNIPEARNYSVFSKPQPPERVVFEGKEWDYVFDVTTDDGRVLKLTYNVGEDTMWAAQRFVEKHNLPIKFLEKVSTLLRTQVPSGQIGSSTSTAPFTDPFTGGGRYVPSSFLNQNGGGNIDPLTGSDRYVPGAELADPKSSNLGPTDPLTGSGAYVSGQAGFMPNSSRIIDKKRPISELVPLRDFFVFGVEQSSTKAVAKLRENNEAQPDEHKLNVEQLRALEEIMSVPNFSAKDIHISAIDRGCLWSLDKIIPVLDAFRLALLNSDMNKIYCSMKSVRGSPPVGPQTLKRLHALLISSATDPVRILVCRALANAAVHSWGQEMLLSDTKTNLSAVVHQIKSKKPAVQLAAASALANWALVLLRHTESGSVTELGPREDALREITEGLRCVDGFSDLTQIAQIRLLQTIATLMWGDATVIKLAKSRDICTIVNRIKDALADEMGKTVARDVVEMTYAV